MGNRIEGAFFGKQTRGLLSLGNRLAGAVYGKQTIAGAVFGKQTSGCCLWETD